MMEDIFEAVFETIQDLAAMAAFGLFFLGVWALAYGITAPSLPAGV